MIDTILDVAARIDELLWGPWTLVFIGSVSLFLTVRSRAFQVRGLGEIFRTTFGSLLKGSTAPEGPSEPEGEVGEERKKGRMTPFQATSTALASTVGMGSIAGMAVALSIGGPGAIFWMWLLALISTITKTAEITLAVHYRDIDETGRIRGGPMYYIRRGLGWPALASVFSLAIIANALFSASLLQAHTVGRSFLASYGTNPYLVAGLMTLVTATVVIGGIRRIGRVSEALVPLMSSGLHRGRPGPLPRKLAGDSPGFRLDLPPRFRPHPRSWRLRWSRRDAGHSAGCLPGDVLQ